MTSPDRQAQTLREAVARQAASREAARTLASDLAAQKATPSESDSGAESEVGQ